MSHSFRIVCFTGLVALGGTGLAADYYVAPQGDDANTGAAEAPFATIDKAVRTAQTAGDVIHVLPGTYETTLGLYNDDNAKWGPNLCVKMVGAGATRDEVVLKSNGTHRTLRMAANAWVENMTLEGEPTFKADRGGVVEMTGGVLTNCVVRNGTATGNGGNLYMTAGVVADCVISNGTATGLGGNLCMTAGVTTDSLISNGVAKTGGNVYNRGRLTRCRIVGGKTSASDGNDGGGIWNNGNAAVLEDCLVTQNGNCALVQEGAAKVVNCTFADNEGGAVFGYGSASKATAWYNCVFYGNHNADGTARDWRGDQPTAMSGCAFSNAGLTLKYTDCVYNIDGTAFVDAEAGNFHLCEGSPLVDKGTLDTRTDASVLDLDRNPRMSGPVDIGCYEYQKQDMTVSMRYAREPDCRYAPVTVAFASSVEHAPSETVTYEYDFGDGGASETTAESVIEHVYAKPGIYTVTIRATSGDAVAEMVYENYVTVYAQTVYVFNEATPCFPYDTPETGWRTVGEAVAAAVEGTDIQISDGIYEQTAKIVLDKAVGLRGNSENPGAVILRNTAVATADTTDRRVLSVEHDGATVQGVTLEDGQVYHRNGGNLNISAGVVSNCVIRGGVVRTDTGAEFGMGSAVVLTGKGMVTHCVITNNVVHGCASDRWLCGGAVVFPWGSNGKLKNSLVAHNVWETGEDEGVPSLVNGAAGLVYHGSTGGSVVENCTIVDNAIMGACGAESAAGVRCDWNSVVRNSVIVGNVRSDTGASSDVYLVFAENEWKDRLNACVTETALPSGNATCRAAAKEGLFRDWRAGDYRPRTLGALVDAGAVFADVPAVDLAGRPRVFGKAIDIGCYECQLKAGFIISIR